MREQLRHTTVVRTLLAGHHLRCAESRPQRSATRRTMCAVYYGLHYLYVCVAAYVHCYLTVMVFYSDIYCRWRLRSGDKYVQGCRGGIESRSCLITDGNKGENSFSNG